MPAASELFQTAENLYYGKNGFKQDKVAAKIYYEQAAQTGFYGAQKQLLLISNLNLVTAEDWQSLGDSYYLGNNLTKDYVVSRACYEHAIEINPKHADSLYMLGFLYQRGESVSKDLDKARKYYESAAQENHYEAKKQYLLMVNFEFDAAQWSSLGDDYHFSKNGKKQDNQRARICYEEALRKELQHVPSLYNLGLLNEAIYSTSNNIADLNKAKEYYEKAAKTQHYESLKRLIALEVKLEVSQPMTANRWYQKGENYDPNAAITIAAAVVGNTPVFKRDYLKAQACYEFAIELDPNHINSLYALGCLYKSSLSPNIFIDLGAELARAALYSLPFVGPLVGLTFALNISFRTMSLTNADDAKSEFARHSKQVKVIAMVNYFTKAAELGHYEAKKEVLFFSNPSLKTANEWYGLGENYHYTRNGNQQDYQRARACYELAVKKQADFAPANHELGKLYENGNGTPNNINKAKEYFQKAAIAGYYEAKKRLLFIEYPTNTDVQWDELGENYYRATNNKIKDYVAARACYEHSISLNPKYINALHSLGWLYQHGLGVDKALNTARDIYEKAVSEGCNRSKKQLLKINNPSLTKAQEYYNLGEEYFFEKNNKVKDYPRARACYEIALDLEATHIPSLYKLGQIYELGLVRSDKNFEEARKYYEQIPANNTLRRKAIRGLERTIVIESHNTSNSVNKFDAKNDTTLHRAAKGKYLNICARLILFGADKQLLDADSKKPFQYLAAADQQKVTDLQNTLSILIGQLHQSAPAILQTRLFIDNGSLPDNDKRRKAFDELYQISEIQPLLDLAKLAALGLHDLSDPKNERKKFIDADYDSDDDDNEKLSENQKLSFRFDSKKPTVNGMIHYGHDGEEGEGSYGVYLPKTNIIYYGAQRNKVDEVRATMIHELTHFIAYEVFKNDCKPFNNQSPEQATLEAIKNDLRSRKMSLDPILALAFHKDYEVAQQSDAELIVRVPQMLAEYGVIVGLQKLQQQAPNLLDYYKNTFLPAVKAHCDKLENRALRGWPKDLFMKSRTTEYVPQLSCVN